MSGTITLHLGVVDAPYKDGKTTGTVATILEGKYGLMQKFADIHREDITRALVRSLLNTPLRAGLTSSAVFEDGCESIKDKFTDYINTVEHGIETKAAEGGVSKRKKRARKGGKQVHPARTPFVDTGLYRASFKAWVEP